MKPALLSFAAALLLLGARLPGRAAGVATDALACMALVVFLAVPNAVRVAAAGGDVRRSALNGAVALSAATWMFALLPPRPGAYSAAAAQSDLFFAYLPLSGAALPVAGLTMLGWTTETPLAVATRVAAVTAVLSVALGVVVRTVCGGEGASEVLQRGALVGGAAAVAAAALAVAERRGRAAARTR